MTPEETRCRFYAWCRHVGADIRTRASAMGETVEYAFLRRATILWREMEEMFPAIGNAMFDSVERACYDHSATPDLAAVNAFRLSVGYPPLDVLPPLRLREEYVVPMPKGGWGTPPEPRWPDLSTDPWFLERSRAMRAEMGAAPQDESIRDAITQRHLLAAMEERGITSAGNAAWENLLWGLESAAVDDVARHLGFAMEDVTAPRCARCSAPNGTTPGCLSCAVKRRYDRVTQEREASR